MCPIEEDANGRRGAVVPRAQRGECRVRQIGMVDTEARRGRRGIVAETRREQVIGEETERVLIVVRPTELQVREKFVQRRHAGIGEGGQFRVQFIRARDAEQERIVYLRERPQPLQPSGETCPAPVQTDDDDLRLRCGAVEEAQQISLVAEARDIVGADRREIGGERRGDLIEQENIGVRMGEKEEARTPHDGACEHGSPRRFRMILAIGNSGPIEDRKGVRLERQGRRQIAARCDHRLEVVIDRQHLGVAGDGVKPRLAPGEEEHHDIGERARTEAATDRQMHFVA